MGYPVKEIVELVAAVMLPVTFLGILVQRLWSKKSIGTRVIQFAAVSLMFPTIIILSIEGVLEGTAVGTLLGGLAGYLLSGVSGYDQAKGAQNGAPRSANDA